MKRGAARGYTIVEVIIVLAITTLLFFSAVLVFNGQRQGTDFSQSMQDLNSKIQDYANQVVTSSYPDSENYSCSVNSSGHVSVSTPGASGTDCLFLGLAIQAFTDDTSLQTYTILGSKDIYIGGDTGNPATTIDQANPEPAIVNGVTPKYVLTDTYTLGAGLSIKSSTSTGNPPYYGLVGLYNGLLNDNASGTTGSSALLLRGYPCTPEPLCKSSPPGGLLTHCLEGKPPCTSPAPLTQWTLCLQEAGRTAQLKVNGSPGGISTKVDFTAC